MTGLRLGRLSCVPFLLVAVLLCTARPAGAAILDAPWTGSGDGTTTVVADGATSDPEFQYQFPGAKNGSWSFSTVAGSARSVPVAWDYSGFNAFFQVEVGMTWFVRRSGADVAGASLVADGPADCCDPPSGGFDYSGTTTFPDLQPGDVYGFRMTGGNDDSAATLGGTLVLQEVDDTPPSITPTVTGQAGSGGFYTGPSTVKWTVSDDGSRVTSTTGCEDAAVTADTAGTTFTCTAVSRGGTGTQSVTIKQDSVAPQLSVPTVIVQPASGPAGAIVTFAATATDALDPQPSVRCTPGSGALFPVGTTTVTCTASDAAGNATTKSFDTVVLPPAFVPPPVQPSSTPKAARSRAVLVWRYVFDKSRTRLLELKLRNLPSGTTVTVACKGRGCPKALKHGGVAMQNKRASLKLTKLVKRFLQNRTRIIIAIESPGTVTTIKTLKMRNGSAPRLTTTCRPPGAAKPAAC